MMPRCKSFVAVRNRNAFNDHDVVQAEREGLPIVALSDIPVDQYKEHLGGEEVVFRTSYGTDVRMTEAQYNAYKEGAEQMQNKQQTAPNSREWKQAMYDAGAHMNRYRALLSTLLYTDVPMSRLRVTWWSVMHPQKPIIIPALDCLATSSEEGLGLLKIRHDMGHTTKLLMVDRQKKKLLAPVIFDPADAAQQAQLKAGMWVKRLITRTFFCHLHIFITKVRVLKLTVSALISVHHFFT